MTATSLKLPEDLKRRIERLAENAHKSPHAFMIEALTREAERSELRERFASDAALAEKEAMTSGRALGFSAAFGHLQAPVSRPRARPPPAAAAGAAEESPRGLGDWGRRSGFMRR